jgi:predicted Holliday junction resolvase-like endonuclease
MIEFIILLAIIIIVVVGGIFYIRRQINSVKQFVMMEIKKLVDVINNAQYNEFNFDKQNEQNIKRLEKQLIDVAARLDSLTSME